MFLFAFMFQALFALNIAQVNKDIQRCEKSDFKDSGCSIYVKMNVPKK